MSFLLLLGQAPAGVEAKVSALELSTGQPVEAKVSWLEFNSAAADSTTAAICLNEDGALTYYVAADETKRKLYLNDGLIYARYVKIPGDRAILLSGAFITANT